MIPSITYEHAETLQKKYDRLIHMVRRMRGAQREYVKYYAKEDKAVMMHLQREVDKLIDEEVKFKKSKQNQINF